MIKLLLVEDDLDLAGNIIDYLELEDMLCDHASNGVAALTLMAQGNYQAIVLDINLPKLDGLQVCARAREHGNDTPIIMLTARDQLSDKVVGFDMALMIIWLNPLLWKSWWPGLKRWQSVVAASIRS